MLLLDNNISPRLCKKLDFEFPGIVNIEDMGLENSTDTEVWEFARNQQLTIVSPYRRQPLFVHKPYHNQLSRRDKYQ